MEHFMHCTSKMEESETCIVLVSVRSDSGEELVAQQLVVVQQDESVHQLSLRCSSDLPSYVDASIKVYVKVEEALVPVANPADTSVKSLLRLVQGTSNTDANKLVLVVELAEPPSVAAASLRALPPRRKSRPWLSKVISLVAKFVITIEAIHILSDYKTRQRRERRVGANRWSGEAGSSSSSDSPESGSTEEEGDTGDDSDDKVALLVDYVRGRADLSDVAKFPPGELLDALNDANESEVLDAMGAGREEAERAEARRDLDSLKRSLEERHREENPSQEKQQQQQQQQLRQSAAGSRNSRNPGSRSMPERTRLGSRRKLPQPSAATPAAATPAAAADADGTIADSAPPS